MKTLGESPPLSVRRWATSLVAAAAICLTTAVGGGRVARAVRSTQVGEAEVIPTMEEGREQATRVICDVFSSLRTFGLQPRFVDGSYSACTEDSVGWRWRCKTKGRLDHPAGQSGSLAFARRVRDALAADEWELLDGVLWTVDGIQDAEGRWIVRAAREDVEIDVTSYDAEPLVLVLVLGPCLPTTESERQRYRAAKTERIDIGDDPDGES